MHEEAQAEIREVPRCVSLPAAARHFGVGVGTLKRWLEADCGRSFPNRGKGYRWLVSVDDLRKLTAARSPKKAWENE